MDQGFQQWEWRPEGAQRDTHTYTLTPTHTQTITHLQTCMWNSGIVTRGARTLRGLLPHPEVTGFQCPACSSQPLRPSLCSRPHTKHPSLLHWPLPTRTCTSHGLACPALAPNAPQLGPCLGDPTHPDPWPRPVAERFSQTFAAGPSVPWHPSLLPAHPSPPLAPPAPTGSTLLTGLCVYVGAYGRQCEWPRPPFIQSPLPP